MTTLVLAGKRLIIPLFLLFNTVADVNAFLALPFTVTTRQLPSKLVYVIGGSPDPNAGEDNGSGLDSSSEETQQRIDKMMMDSQSKDTLFGLPKKDTSNEDISPFPMFTGIIVLLGSTALTFYCFYVFFTGDDPLMNF